MPKKQRISTFHSKLISKEDFETASATPLKHKHKGLLFISDKEILNCCTAKINLLRTWGQKLNMRSRKLFNVMDLTLLNLQ